MYYVTFPIFSHFSGPEDGECESDPGEKQISFSDSSSLRGSGVAGKSSPLPSSAPVSSAHPHHQRKKIVPPSPTPSPQPAPFQDGSDHLPSHHRRHVVLGTSSSSAVGAAATAAAAADSPPQLPTPENIESPEMSPIDSIVSNEEDEEILNR